MFSLEDINVIMLLSRSFLRNLGAKGTYFLRLISGKQQAF